MEHRFGVCVLIIYCFMLAACVPMRSELTAKDSQTPSWPPQFPKYLPPPGPAVQPPLLPPPAEPQILELPEQNQILNGMRAEDFVMQGQLTPTVYFKPVIQDSEDRCQDEERVALKNKVDVELIRLCKVDYLQCALQGSCQIRKESKVTNINYHSLVDGQPRFFQFDLEDCPFGYGMKAICLDPMYSLAADPAFHRPGDVIFVPAVVGLEISEGHKHNGYFIIRDRGGKIKGAHRFDFYSGFMSWESKANPFRNLGLGDKKNAFKYFKVSGESAKTFQALRAFPKLPK